MSEFDRNVVRAQEYLKRFRGKTVSHLIGGKHESGNGATFETLSPVDNSVLAKVARGTRTEIDRAAEAAKRAFA
ncbi:MAG: aldehyde dehydrogenase family protein, partial [Xanthobacteraceae bacterium]